MGGAVHPKFLCACSRLTLVVVSTPLCRFGLREKAGAQPQTYALGLKEVWEVSWLCKHALSLGD